MGHSTRITLVRHAQSEMNLQAAQLVGGRSNHTPLTRDGVSAAHELGRELAGGAAPDVVAHTCALRSIQTAQAIIAGAGWNTPLLHENGLLELSQGRAEGQARELWWTPAAIAAMNADPLGHRLAEDGENHREVQARMRAALHSLARRHPGGHVLAVGHGIAIRTLAWSILGGDHATFRSLDLPNLARVEVLVDGNDLSLTSGSWAPTRPGRGFAGPSPHATATRRAEPCSA